MYYIRSKMSFQHCLSFIVSAIHVLIQQTFTGYPLYSRHCARQAGSMRRISRSRISAHYCSLCSCHNSLSFCTRFSPACFGMGLRVNVSSCSRSCLICTPTHSGLDQACLLCTTMPPPLLDITQIIALSSPIDGKLQMSGLNNHLLEINNLGFRGKLQTPRGTVK